MIGRMNGWVGREMWAVFAAFLAGCGGPKAEISGSIGEASFSDVQAVLSGGHYLLFIEGEFDCVDADFVDAHYNEGEALDAPEFVGLQVYTEDDEYSVGTYTLGDSSPISVTGLLNGADRLTVERGREGSLNIDAISDGSVEGSFEFSFADSSVSGTFRSEYCRNMVP
jgi:hypothetical protein